MSGYYLSLIMGIGLIMVGVIGLIPALHTPWPEDAPDLVVENAYGYLLGIFPNNMPHTLLHLASGMWGVAAARSASGRRLFFHAVAIIFGILAILGMIPVLNTTFGLMPLFGSNVWLHALLSAIAAYAGWMALAERVGSAPAMVDVPRQQNGGIPSTVAIGGHPIHSYLTPFPIAFLIGAFATDLAYWWTTLPWYVGPGEFFAQASRWMLGIGLASGTLAALIGLIDFLTIQQVRMHQSGWIHTLSSLSVLVLALGNLLLRRGQPATAVLPWGIILSAMTMLALFIGWWYGGQLVYRHMIGVNRQNANSIYRDHHKNGAA